MSNYELASYFFGRKTDPPFIYGGSLPIALKKGRITVADQGYPASTPPNIATVSPNGRVYYGNNYRAILSNNRVIFSETISYGLSGQKSFRRDSQRFIARLDGSSYGVFQESFVGPPTLLQTISLASSEGLICDWSYDGEYFAIGAGTTRLYRASSPTAYSLQSSTGTAKTSIAEVAFHPTGSFLALKEEFTWSRNYFVPYDSSQGIRYESLYDFSLPDAGPNTRFGRTGSAMFSPDGQLYADFDRIYVLSGMSVVGGASGYTALTTPPFVLTAYDVNLPARCGFTSDSNIFVLAARPEGKPIDFKVYGTVIYSRGPGNVFTRLPYIPAPDSPTVGLSILADAPYSLT